MTRVTRGAREGTLTGGLPYLSFGTGPPLIVCEGLTAEHANPRGLDRMMTLRLHGPLGRHFTVYVVNRRPGLATGTTMADIAGDYAHAITADFEPPVHVEGISTGGSVAQQLAVDHGDVVDRLVIASSACRLSPAGRRLQTDFADLVLRGRPRRAYALLGSSVTTHPVGRPLMAAMMWLVGASVAPDDPSDMVTTIRAEDAFDASGDLHRITAPTLIVAGARDGFYTPALFRRTAAGIPNARLYLDPRRGHVRALTDRRAAHAIVSFLAGPIRGSRREL